MTTLSGLTIGSGITLTPEFSSEVLSYTAETSNATNKVTATPKDPDAEVTILVGDTEIENGSSAEWEIGENTLTITVYDGDPYVVTVTRS